MTVLRAIRSTASAVGASRARLATAWAAAALLALALLAGRPGISGDEATVLAAADGDAGAAHAGPTLAADLARATHAALSRAGLSHLRSARAATALAGALLTGLLALLAWDLAGRAGALLAPALFWLAPRHLHAGLAATPEVTLAALAVALALAWRRAAAAASAREALRPALLAGALFGAALAVRPDAWVLVPALALHAAASRRLARRAGETVPTGAPWALAAMALLGPALVLVLWGVPWRTPAAAIAGAFAPRSAGAWRELTAPFGVPRTVYPAVASALALPASVAFAYGSGLCHAVARLAGAVRARAAALASDELLLLLLPAAFFSAAAARLAPPAPGLRPWLGAMPFLALLGARALVAAARTAWPSRAAPLAGALALLVLYPALRATVHAYPAGASGWSELAGGAPGAASLGLRRQDGGEAAASLLARIAERARPGARVWFGNVAPEAVRIYAHDGRLRPDLSVAASPETADLAVVTLDGAGREAEYRAWSAFRTSRPSAGAYLDEVPLAFVYARPGAWR